MTGKPIVIKAAPALDTPLGPAWQAFKEGGVIAYPTETFYGLCVDPFNPVGVGRLFSLKGRPADRPVSLIIADLSMLKELAAEVPRAAAALMERFWPGPLTLVLKAAPRVPASLIASTGKVGVRLSSHPVARALSEKLSSPITATSANPSGAKPPATPEEVLGYFNGSLDVLIDGGELKGGLGSTVADISEGKAVIIREGEIPSSDLFEALS
ncbi:MAG: hypothetical protein BMS9Abin24_175 [Thermodesulfobacteriota bacterium]|nr:MAG: hypothetical protein BMS9Abin24_175 [Thermodesulfobacteriota bacterium]